MQTVWVTLREKTILGDPGAASLFEGQKSPCELTLTEPVLEIFKYIFLANQRDESENFWNWFGKSKFPGALLPFK